jgi:hypothetical protein
VLKGKRKVAWTVVMMAVHLAVLKVDWLDWLVEKMVG